VNGQSKHNAVLFSLDDADLLGLVWQAEVFKVSGGVFSV
jgi:hypothetical protein